jgi:hypothetical protein
MNRFTPLPIVLALSGVACGTNRLVDAYPAESTATEGTATEGTATEGEPSSTSSSSSGGDTETESGSSEDTETGSSEDTDTETSGTATGFVPDVPPPPGSSCDPWSQDCPEGEKCVPYVSSGESWDDHKCVPILGDRGTGEPCTYAGPEEATDDCDAANICWNADEEGFGTCHALCSGTPDMPMCPESSFCSIFGDGVVNICIPTCDPVAQDCAGEGDACYWDGTLFVCFPTAGGIDLGEPCGFINDCATGFACLVAEVVPACEGAGCCAAFCDLGLGDAQCEGLPGTSCVPFFENGEPPPGYEHVGVCILP